MLSHSFSRDKDSTDYSPSHCLIFWVLALVSALIFDPCPYRNGSVASIDRKDNLNPFHAQVHSSSPGTVDLITCSLNRFCIFIVPYSSLSLFETFPKCKQMLFTSSFVFLSVVCNRSFISFHPLTFKNLLLTLLIFPCMVSSSEWL